MEDNDGNIKVDLKKFKGHHRKFPWSLIIRIFVVCVSVGMIFLLVRWTEEIKANRAIKQNDKEIEIEYNP